MWMLLRPKGVTTPLLVLGAERDRSILPRKSTQLIAPKPRKPRPLDSSRCENDSLGIDVRRASGKDSVRGLATIIGLVGGVATLLALAMTLFPRA